MDLHAQLKEKFEVEPSEMSFVAVALALSHAGEHAESQKLMNQVPPQFRQGVLDASRALNLSSR